jgi:ATP-binding cassette subfamily C (CFTR/MRP) protein 1
LDTNPGAIKVDGIDLSLVPRSVVRQRCFITVPQDAVVLAHASLRFNLDPWGFFSDEDIIASLQKTHLDAHFGRRSLNDTEVMNGGSIMHTDNYLDTPVTVLPHMSTGQSQLFSLARAILQAQSSARGSSVISRFPNTKPILLLDEATSSLDPVTESAMHDIIRQEFIEKQHTVIVVSHRLDGMAKDMRRGQDLYCMVVKREAGENRRRF